MNDLEMPSFFLVFFAVFAVFFVGIVVLIIVSATRRARAAREAGLDPWTADVQVMGALAGSAALAPDRPIEERLAELDRLHEAGTITADERQRARDRILGG